MCKGWAKQTCFCVYGLTTFIALSQRNVSYIIIIADEKKCQWSLNTEQLGYRSKILKKYVDAKLEREVYFLYGLQHLMHEMQHPNSKL